MADIVRINQLCDLENIRDLRYRYAEHADKIDGRSGDLAAFANLFTNDATFDIGGGPVTGRKAIEEMLQGRTTPWHYSIHYTLNPLITLDGDRASGRISVLLAVARARHSTPAWRSGLYHDEYVRTPEGWRFQSVRFQMHFADPAFEGGN